MSFLFKTRKIGIAAVIMGASVLLSRFMGLGREMVIGHFHGATGETDVYFASFFIPDFINYLLAGGYFSITLIPVLSRVFSQNKEDGWKLFSAVFWWGCILIFVATLIAFIFAPNLAKLVEPGFNSASQERLSLFLRIILPAQIFFILGSCFTAILYLRRQFAVPALTPLVYNGCTILLGLIFIQTGMTGFCWGVLLGSFLGSFVLPFWAVRKGHLHITTEDDRTGAFRLHFCLRHKELKKILFLALPLMLGQSMVVLDEQFPRTFGSLAEVGSISLLNYARRIMQMPIGVVAQAAGVASFPFLASLVASKSFNQFNEALATALKNVFAILIPCSALMILLAEPIIAVIYQHGSFSATSTLQAALLLRIMLISVVFWGAQQLLGRAFYSRENTITPAVAGTLVTILFIPVYYFAAKNLGAKGIALTSAVGVAFYTFLLRALWVRRHSGAALLGTLHHALWALLASILALVPAGLVLYALTNPLAELRAKLPAIFANLLELALCSAVFVGFYLIICHFIKPQLINPLRPFFNKILRRVNSQKQPKPTQVK